MRPLTMPSVFSRNNSDGVPLSSATNTNSRSVAQATREESGDWIGIAIALPAVERRNGSRLGSDKA